MTTAIWPNPSQGRWYASTIQAAGSGNTAFSANTLYAYPIFISQKITAIAIGVNVTTLSAGNVRCGIYTDSAGVPSALLVDGGSISTGTTGFKSATISTVLIPGWYWLAAVFSGTPSTSTVGVTSAQHWLGFSSGTDTTIKGGVSVSFNFAALPDPFTAGSTLIANAPRVMITS